ncbi:MAG: FeoB-associated Cys-rich membrane protein [Oscillospiraceae bacterium]|nr:FeoB-associated Cys-rich membrane protein [Oscillospiraceae bacterium]
MENIIIIAIVALIIVGIVIYLIKLKKSGRVCAGCPHSKQCSGKCNENNNFPKS